jgi:hypothetical protein
LAKGFASPGESCPLAPQEIIPEESMGRILKKVKQSQINYI